MPAVRMVTHEDAPPAAATAVGSSSTSVWIYLGVTMISLALIGTWLMWFSAYTQRNLHEEDIRAACRRAMPESADRCFDTVVIQRGGIRR